MTGFDQAPLVEAPAGASPRRSRLFWMAIALSITAILLVCTALILIAATRG